MYYKGFLKVAAASPKVKLGDSQFNIKKIIEILADKKTQEAAIVAFPELCITGYAMGDLFFQKYLYDEASLATKYLLENNPYDGVVILGTYVDINDVLYNSIIVIQKDKILGIIPKTYLPHTNEFYEARWFLNSQNIVKKVKSINYLGQTVPFGKMLFHDESEEIVFGAEVCADVWAPNSPNETLYSNGALIVFNASASPSHVGKKDKRRILTKSSSMKFNSAYVYVSNNASESTSEVVFSGHNIIAVDGKIIAEDDKITMDSKIMFADIDISSIHYYRRNNSYYKVVQENNLDTLIQKVQVNIKRTSEFKFEKEFDKFPFVPKSKEEFNDVINIQAYSILKRLEHINSKITVLGLSGGLDSTLALLTLVRAYDIAGIDRSNIHVLIMPSAQTNKDNLNNAKRLTKYFAVTTKIIKIDQDVSRQIKLLEHDEALQDTTFENIQARFRTFTLMNYANKNSGIVVGTSDMSEIALGWSTFNGDHMAMYGVNGGLAKTALIATVDYYKGIYPEIKAIIESVINAPISPELVSGSHSTEELIGKYEINDFILYHFLTNGADNERIVCLLKHVFGLKDNAAKDYLNNFNKRFYNNQFKRLTTPEHAKILGVSLSPRSSLKINGDTSRLKY